MPEMRVDFRRHRTLDRLRAELPEMQRRESKNDNSFF